MSRKSSSRKAWPVWQALVRRELDLKFMGTILVVLSLLTLLSLLSLAHGRLANFWLNLLQRGFGAGVWGLPLAMGSLGFWVIIHAMEQVPSMSWQKPMGVLLLYLCFVVAIDLAPGRALMEVALLLSPAASSAGGWIGHWLGQQLQGRAGIQGSWLILAGLALTGIYMMQKMLCQRGLHVLWQGLQHLWQRMGEVPAQAHAPKSWPDTRLYRVLHWMRSLQVDTAPLGKWYGHWEQSYLSMLRQLRRQRPAGAQSVPSAPAHTGAIQTETPLAAPGPAAPSPAVMNSAPMALKPQADHIGLASRWQLPDLNLILEDRERQAESDEHIRERGTLLQDTLALSGVPASFEGAYRGPSVTQYLIRPGCTERLDSKGQTRLTRVEASQIARLQNELALAAQSVRIEASVPGTGYVGIEIPNTISHAVSLKALCRSQQFQAMDAELPLALGEDVRSQSIVADLARMPHLLIAGAAGTGKSACINAIITTLLLVHTPDTLRFLVVDPKRMERSAYNGIPHWLDTAVIGVEETEQSLDWCVQEMERRYRLLNQARARDIRRCNARRRMQGEAIMPYIVVIIDEMADLMRLAPQAVERSVCRLARMARTVGMHLIMATRRPSADVITGLIKANFPVRIAFAVASQTDSRVILNMPGAERLLGQGDMLFAAPDAARPERVQGTWVSDQEIHRMVAYWKAARRSRAQALAAEQALQAWLASPQAGEPPVPVLQATGGKAGGADTDTRPASIPSWH